MYVYIYIYIYIYLFYLFIRQAEQAGHLLQGNIIYKYIYIYIYIYVYTFVCGRGVFIYIYIYIYICIYGFGGGSPSSFYNNYMCIRLYVRQVPRWAIFSNKLVNPQVFKVFQLFSNGFPTFTKGLPSFPTFKGSTAPRPPGVQVGNILEKVGKPLGFPRFPNVFQLFSNFY